MPKLTNEQIEEIYQAIIELPVVDENAPEKDPRGRLTKFHNGLIKDILHFFNIDAYEEKRGEYDQRIRCANDYPTVEAWCYKNGITDQTYQNWRKTNPRFREASDLVRLNQKSVLITNSLHGKYNTHFAAMIGRIQFAWDTKEEENKDAINTVVIDSDDTKL